ncbi:hypothetical protein CAPTEDRAFT_226963 [Capitella teleta]|uniref:Acyltransferase n=1 Tax=Capitella teleta TaxID=283909 RepID=R7TN57_CAPTE|nr:hypothetical protein CAPTEDRAFT_226963 [Capitella teleta]|eukprot:ELT95074.1 hypothetical protein CAPTEDRAFT_226963 [Capitella teleta]
MTIITPDHAAETPLRILGIEFAPLNIPFERRLQTAAVLQWTLCFLFLGFGSLGLTLYLLSTRFYWMVLVYSAWYAYDWKRQDRGGRFSPWVRGWKVWKHFANFFPIKLVKTAELDPSKNYIFGYHPHGIMAFGAFNNFATEGTGFSRMFPGIKPRLLILAGQFLFPFHREYVMTSGCCSVSRESIDWNLTKEGPGNALVLIIGGAAEALEARKDSFVLKLNTRRGFVKMALKYGASLVPVFSFGENDLFDQMSNPEGSRIRSLQAKMTKLLGFSMPLFHGRGVFNYSFGILPFRKPINTIVGGPIHVEKNSSPSQEEIDLLHSRYISSLKDLFERHKAEYGVAEKQHLRII